MDPLRGRAEQISARTPAVIIMNMMTMMNDDLECINKAYAPRSVDGIVPNCSGSACE